MESVRFTREGQTMLFTEDGYDGTEYGNHVLDIRGLGVPGVNLRTRSGLEQDGELLLNSLYNARHITFNLGFAVEDRSRLYARKQRLHELLGNPRDNKLVRIDIGGENGETYFVDALLERGPEGFTRDRFGNIEQLTVQVRCLNPFLRSGVNPAGDPFEHRFLDGGGTGLSFPITFPILFPRTQFLRSSFALDYRGTVETWLDLDLQGWINGVLRQTDGINEPVLEVINHTTGGVFALKEGAEVPDGNTLRLTHENSQARLQMVRTDTGEPDMGIPNPWNRVDVGVSVLDKLFLAPGINNMQIRGSLNTAHSTQVLIRYYNQWLGI